MISNLAKIQNLKDYETDEPLHSFPISYKVDNKKSLSDPIGVKLKLFIQNGMLYIQKTI